MILKKQEFGAQVWIYFGFSVFHTGSEVYIQVQMYTHIHLNILISVAEGSAMSFNLPRPIHLLLVVMIEYIW